MSGSFPTNLTIYLSDRCNLACSYCYVAIERDGAASIGLPRLREGIEYFLARAPAGARKISFLGGEPLLDYPLVQRAVEHVRSKAEKALPMHLFTNGLLLDDPKLSFFRENDVDLTVGFGCGAVKLPAPVASALRTRANRLGASVVVTPASVGALLGDVDSLYRAGFRRISFTPDVGAVWGPRDAARLGVALDGFRRYYGALIREGAEPFEVANIYEALAEAQGRRDHCAFPCDRLILAADGRFYACDKLFGAPLESISAWSVGSPREGLDESRRRAFIHESLDAARGELGASPDGGCPAGVYSLWRIGEERSAERLRERMRSFGRVSALVRGALLGVARESMRNEAFRRAHHLTSDGREAGWTA